MTLICLVQTWSFLLLIFRALFVQTVQDRKLNITELSSLTSQSTFNSLNQTSLPSDISANKLAVFCDGHEYGINLIAADCRDAITGIKRSRQRLSFRDRSADPQTWDVGLPSRQIGGKDATVGLLVSLPFDLTSKQYRDFAWLNWNSNLGVHPLLQLHLMYFKLPSPYSGSASQDQEPIQVDLLLT